jgi:hypothetical protein
MAESQPNQSVSRLFSHHSLCLRAEFSRLFEYWRQPLDSPLKLTAGTPLKPLRLQTAAPARSDARLAKQLMLESAILASAKKKNYFIVARI